MMAKPEQLFTSLQADDLEPEITKIESLCMECGKDGETRLLLTRIPFFKDVVLMSFSCPHCGYQNNELQSAARVDEKGVKFELTVSAKADLDRRVVKSDHATVEVPSLELTIPAGGQKGEITTIEGVLSRVVRGLTQEQPARRTLDPENATKIDAFIVKIQKTLEVESPFSLILVDPSGGSFIENPCAPAVDPHLKVIHFTRTLDEDHELGLFTREEIEDGEPEPVENGEPADLKEQVLQFQTNCPECNAPCETNMKVTDIPYFKEVVIMATVCEACGNRTNEVKSGGGISPKGKKITLELTDPELDMSRDVLKSETCHFMIPELDLEIGAGTLGGRFTTLEGLLKALQEQLTEANPLFLGDSSNSEVKSKFKEVADAIGQIVSGEKKATVILDDPAGNSYLQNVYAPEEDPMMKTEEYERSYDQNEELGLNDMRTEAYEES